MKVVNIGDIKGTERETHFHCGMTSTRPVLENDKMGFSVCKTEIPKGDWRHWHYTNHLESCYCIKGHGLLKDLSTGVVYEIKPDTIYSLDNHDDHEFKAIEDTVLISIFNPPLTGNEVHRKDGSYSQNIKSIITPSKI